MAILVHKWNLVNQWSLRNIEISKYRLRKTTTIYRILCNLSNCTHHLTFDVEHHNLACRQRFTFIHYKISTSCVIHMYCMFEVESNVCSALPVPCIGYTHSKCQSVIGTSKIRLPLWKYQACSLFIQKLYWNLQDVFPWNWPRNKCLPDIFANGPLTLW